MNDGARAGDLVLKMVEEEIVWMAGELKLPELLSSDDGGGQLSKLPLLILAIPAGDGRTPPGFDIKETLGFLETRLP